MKQEDNEAGRPGFSAFSVRLQQILHIDAMMDFSVFSDEVKALLDEDLKDVLAAFSEADFAQFKLRQVANVDELEDVLAKLTNDFHVGFLVKAQQPYFILQADGNLGYSWERSRTKWFFARQYPAAVEHVRKWARNNYDGASTQARTIQGNSK